MDGRDIHPVQRAVEVDSKRKRALVPTHLHLKVEASATDLRLQVDSVTPIPAVIIASIKFSTI